MKYGDDEWQKVEPCWICEKTYDTGGHPEWCFMCHRWQCRQCMNRCPALERQETLQEMEGNPCGICGRLEQDG